MKFFTLLLALMTLATQQLNKPYSYATEGPNTFDCSGFVCYCYKGIFDINLPRSAKDIGYSDYELIENIDDLEKGDVVCFNTNKGDKDLSDHVGIYLGDQEFIHSSSGQGRVIISPINEGYYGERFSWGKRIISENNYLTVEEN